MTSIEQFINLIILLIKNKKNILWVIQFNSYHETTYKLKKELHPCLDTVQIVLNGEDNEIRTHTR